MEGRNGFLRRFEQLSSYCGEIEIRNRVKIPFSSQIVPKGLVDAEKPVIRRKEGMGFYIASNRLVYIATR